MCNALPVLHEGVTPLKQRLHHEQKGRKKSRLQMLYLLASGQAQTRRDVARLPGGHRHTTGHWLARYEAGGLAALLDAYGPAGKPLSLPPGVLAAREQASRQPAGFASCEAARPWLKQHDRLAVKYHTLYTIIRTRFHAKLEVPRPRHTKNPLRLFGTSRRPARSSSTMSSRLRIPARCACSARTKVVVAC